MQHRYRILMALLVGCMLLSFGAAPVVRAQEGDAGTVATPPAEAQGEQAAPRFALVAVGDYPEGYFDDLPVAPGETVDLAVRVVNLGNEPLTLQVYRANAVNMVNGGFAAAPADEEAVGATAWIDLPATTVDLGPRGEQEIPFRVTVPADAKPGQYISAITTEPPDAITLPGSSALGFRLSYSISVGILVPGDRSASFQLGEPLVSVNNLLTTISVPITSTGNYLVRPEGELALSNPKGEVVVSSPIAMESVYAGNSTSIELPLLEQIAPGDYVLTLSLTDPESGASGSIEGAKVTVPSAANPRGISVVMASIEPNAEEIAFANIEVKLRNGGSKIAASDVVLEVRRNGEPVDEFPLATNQVLLNGENAYTARYIPAETWQPGTYSFRIVASAVDPTGGQKTVLLSEDLDAEIVVP